MCDGSRVEAINTSGAIEDNDTMFGECQRLYYYYGPMENWMVAANVIHVAINVVSALITIVANAVFLVTYSQTPYLRTSHNFFLVLLAMTDISVGLVSQPLFIVRKIMQIYSINNCAVWVAFQATLYYFSGISFLTVTLVSMERYLAMCRPITHRRDVTPKRMAIVALTVWIVWLSLPIMRFVFSEFFKAFGIFIVGVILVLFAANAYFYVKIYRSFSENKLKNNKQQLQNLTRKTNLKKEARLAKTTACLMVVMVLIHLPIIIGSLYKALAGVNSTYFFGFVPFAYTLVLLNSSFNPLFYCFKNDKIRKAIRMLINGRKLPTRGSSIALEYV